MDILANKIKYLEERFLQQETYGNLLKRFHLFKKLFPHENNFEFANFQGEKIEMTKANKLRFDKSHDYYLFDFEYSFDGCFKIYSLNSSKFKLSEKILFKIKYTGMIQSAMNAYQIHKENISLLH